MAGHLYIGTSGWNYDERRDAFYQETPKREWLGFCARIFCAVEINATFYRLQRRETFRRWRAATPEGFRYALKANRYLTHNRKLADPLQVIRVERDRASALAPKLSAVLWQLPAKFPKHMARLENFARALNRWRTVRHAIEFRDPSCSTPRWPTACADTASPCASRTPLTGRCGTPSLPTWCTSACMGIPSPTPRATATRSSRDGSGKYVAGDGRNTKYTYTLIMTPSVMRLLMRSAFLLLLENH